MAGPRGTTTMDVGSVCGILKDVGSDQEQILAALKGLKELLSRLYP